MLRSLIDRNLMGLLAGLALSNLAYGQSISTNRVATYQLGFSGTAVSILEDYRHSKFPVAHRTLILRGPSGRAVRLALMDGGPNDCRLLACTIARTPKWTRGGMPSVATLC